MRVVTAQWPALVVGGLLSVAGCQPEQLSRASASIRVDPAQQALGPLPLGFVREARVTLRNTGEQPLSGRVHISATERGIAEVRPSTWRLRPGNEATATVRLTATAEGRVETALVFTVDGRALSATAALTADGVLRAFDVDPAAVDFEQVRARTEQRRTIRISNRQGVALPFTLRLPDDTGFRIEGRAAGLIGPGRIEPVELVFRPDRVGAAYATLRVEGECAGPCVVEVPLAGVGASSGLRCPVVVDLGTMNPGGCARSLLTCTSILNETAEVTAWQVEAPSGSFSADAPARREVPPGGTFALPLRFCPSSLGPDAAELHLTVREPRTGAGLVQVDLQGVGGGPDLVAEPGTLRFGGATLGDTTERPLLVGNAGHARLTFDRWSVEGPFALVSEPPATLEPAEASTVRLRFTPPREGLIEGALRIGSDDPDRPELVVSLLGTGVPPAPCAASLTPGAVTFGLVNQGERNIDRVTLRSASARPCAWFEPRIEGSATFQLVEPVPFSGVVTASRSVTFEVAFAPTRASPLGNDSARLVVDLPNAPGRMLQTDLRGVVANSDLLLHPRSLDFGRVGTDVVRQRTVRLYNLSSRTERVTEVALVPGTSLDFALTAPPMPVDLMPGEHVEATVTYGPSGRGKDGGWVSVTVPRYSASFDVPLLGEGDDSTRRARVTGHVCAPDATHPSVGAEVLIRYGDQVVASTTTDDDGGYDLVELAPGSATLLLRKGHFTRSVPVTLRAGQTTEVPRTCLDPTSPSVAVVTGVHDRVQIILQQLGVPYSEFDGISAFPRLLNDRDLLLSYDILMLNCGFDDRAARQPAVVANLEAFLAAGGSIYASDFAYDAIEAVASNMLELSGPDAIQDAAEQGSVTRMRGRVIDPILLRWMPPQLEFNVDLILGYAVVDAYGPASEVLVLGEHGPRSAPSVEPLVVTTAVPGRIAYTSYHYTATQVDPPALIPLAFAIFEL